MNAGKRMIAMNITEKIRQRWLIFILTAAFILSIFAYVHAAAITIAAHWSELPAGRECTHEY
jgi:hypothetical protein